MKETMTITMTMQMQSYEVGGLDVGVVFDQLIAREHGALGVIGSFVQRSISSL